MRVLYFDCFSGISGDMTLGALLDLGVDKNLFLCELDKLKLPGFNILIEKKVNKGITGTDVTVELTGEYAELNEKSVHQHDHEHEHNHNHNGNIEHNHKHDASVHEHQHFHDNSHKERNLTDIEVIIDSSNLRKSVKIFSKKVFNEIAKAEAKVHNKSMNEVHFHEVGAVDSIVDIVGVAICLDLLGVKRVYASALHEGKGFINCQHGLLPIPVPAVLEMLKDSGIPIITEDINTELVTPTGIGIIKSLSSVFGNMPEIVIEKIGYGMGKRETGRLNALRVIVGSLYEEDRLPKESDLEEISVLETNIDDMSPEILGYVLEELFEKGALDAFYTPIYMKKNRPANMLTVLVKKELEQKMVDIIFKETTTIGIRKSITQRYCMDRENVKVATAYGEVRVKVASYGDIKKSSPEYEDCKYIARNEGIPLKNVYSMVQEKSKYLI